MPRLSDEALCIRHWDWSETSQTVSLFGRSLGLVRGLAKGARRERGRFGGGFELMTLGQFEALGKPDGNLLTLTEWTLLESFPRIRTELWANRASFYLADLLQRLMPPHAPHPETFDAAARSLRMLGRGADPIEVTARFEWAVLEGAGFAPQLEVPKGVASIEFDAAQGGFLEAGSSAPGEAGRWRVRLDTVECLRSIARDAADPEAPSEEEDHAPERFARAARLLAVHLRAVIGEEPLTMRQMFPGLPRR
ncbi:MAG: DNA repair protein RecO [Phycisphaerales bacterium]|jgi:recombinational DNA repair protein (RecF pathway)